MQNYKDFKFLFKGLNIFPAIHNAVKKGEKDDNSKVMNQKRNYSFENIDGLFQNPLYNDLTCVATSVPDGIVVIDLDVKPPKKFLDAKDGEYIENDNYQIELQRFENTKIITKKVIEDLMERKAKTIIIETPSGGYHLWFKYGNYKIKNNHSKYSLVQIANCEHKVEQPTVAKPYQGTTAVHLPFCVDNYNEKFGMNHLRNIIYVGVDHYDEVETVPIEFLHVTNKTKSILNKHDYYNLIGEDNRNTSLYQYMKCLNEQTVPLLDGTDRYLTDVEKESIIHTMNECYRVPLDMNELKSSVLRSAIVKEQIEEIDSENKKINARKEANDFAKNIADEIVSQYELIACATVGTEAYEYNGAIYKPIVKNELCVRLINQDNYSLSAAQVENIAKIAIWRCSVSDEILKTMIPPRNYIYFKDCIFDIDTETYIDFSPEYFRTRQLSVNAPRTKPKAKALEFVKGTFMSFANQNSDVYDMLLTFLACCSIDMIVKHLFILYGSGDNGKSTFLNIAKRIVGNTNVSTVAMSDLTGDKYSLAQLRDKNINIDSELEFASQKGSRTLKAITGGDGVVTEKKYENGISNVLIDATLAFAANDLPNSSDKSEAYYQRLRIIPFDNKYNEIRGNIVLGLENMIFEEDNINALMYLILQKVIILKKNQYRVTESVKGDVLKSEHYNDSHVVLKYFHNRFGVKDKGVIAYLVHNVQGSIVYKDYKNLAQDSGDKPVGSTTFTKMLQQLFLAAPYEVGIKNQSVTNSVDKKNYRVYRMIEVIQIDKSIPGRKDLFKIPDDNGKLYYHNFAVTVSDYRERADILLSMLTEEQKLELFSK